MSNYKGQLEGFPSEVVEKMLERQVEQGNKRDVGVFEKFKWADDIFGGFHWANTKEGDDFWQKVIAYKDFALFFSRYPKKDKFTPISEETGKKLAEAMKAMREIQQKIAMNIKKADELLNFTSNSNMGELTFSSKWQPKEGDVVTIESPRGITIGIFKSGEISMGDIWNFYAALHYANGFLVDELIWDKFGDAKIRLATYEERCKFFERLVNEGYKWNAKKLKLTKVEKKWSPVDGDFIYWENKISGGYGICILEGQYLGSGEDFFYYVHLASNNTLRYTKVIGKENRMDRPATDSERQRLLDALRKEGKRWNAEKKRVEDIEFKVGDCVIGRDTLWPKNAKFVERIDIDNYCPGDSWCRYDNLSNGCPFKFLRHATNAERIQTVSDLYKQGKVWNKKLNRIEDIKPKVVEMTMEQVCEKLGVNVKIVKK